MLRRERHYREDAVDPIVRHALVKQIAHRIHEDASLAFPAQWRRKYAVGRERKLACPDGTAF